MDDETLRKVLDALDRLPADDETVLTSVRVPAALRDAARALQAMGMGPSFSEVLVQGARDRLAALAHRAGLDAHYAEHPAVRPSLRSVALALARMDGSPLVDRPDLIEIAVDDLTASGPAVDADDVLIYAAALLAHSAA